MDYFVYAATSLSILAAMLSLMLRGYDGIGRSHTRPTGGASRRSVLTGFAVAGAGVIAIIGAALPTFHAVFDFGLLAALGAVLVVLGFGYAASVRLVPAIERKGRSRTTRSVPRLSDL